MDKLKECMKEKKKKQKKEKRRKEEKKNRKEKKNNKGNLTLINSNQCQSMLLMRIKQLFM